MADRRAHPALLDVNVLIALAWPNHEGHRAARAWFVEESARGWATCPVTESGFVRVSSNRRALPTATTLRASIEMLERLTSLPGHTFWSDDVALVTGNHVDTSRLTDHRQVTDAHLLALCLKRAGRLVTFDKGIDSLADSEPKAVYVLRADSPR